MSGFLALIGLLGVVVFAILLIVAAIRKKTKKIWAICLPASFILFIIGITTLPGASQANSTAQNAITAPAPTPTPTPTPTYTFEELKAKAIGMPYQEMFRDIDNLKGKDFYYSGNVTQVVDYGNGRYLLMVTVSDPPMPPNQFSTNSVFLNYMGSRLLEKDGIEFVGLAIGPRTYTTALGASKTIPEFTAKQARLYQINK